MGWNPACLFTEPGLCTTNLGSSSLQGKGGCWARQLLPRPSILSGPGRKMRQETAADGAAVMVMVVRVANPDRSSGWGHCEMGTGII